MMDDTSRTAPTSGAAWRRRRSISVRSQPVRSKQSAVVTRAQIERQRGAVERVLAFVVLLLSFLGTVVAFHGGWGPVLAFQISVAATGGGIALQIVLTWLQWSYRHVPLLRWSSIAVDTALTALGYGPLVVPWLGVQLAARGVGGSLYVAWAIVGLASFLPAWYPESRLVE